MDFAEFFTDSARELVPLAWRKGLLFLFDMRGPFVYVECDRHALHDALQRLALAALETLHDGFIFLSAQTQWHEPDRAELSISIAGTGARADDAALDRILDRLALQETPLAANGDDSARVARGACPISGGAISFAANRSDGLLFALDLEVRGRMLDDGSAPPHAGSARAWLISDTPRACQSLVRRLQRLGWATSSFASVEQAADHLVRMSAAMARPALVIAAESGRVGIGALRALRRQLPARTQVVLATAIDSTTRCVDTDIELRHWPFSPVDLHEFTHRLHDTTPALSGLTLPAPLCFADRPTALVVDDNAVNLLVASGLLQMAGFEVDTAPGGLEAIARCRERAPQLVLMDVQMPGMDGLEATRALRILQRSGALPPFAIVAATADALELGEHACYEAGMDGYLAKPLSLQAIQREIARVLPGLRIAPTPADSQSTA
ncbi:MAG TPA: response regulator [Albitalea sp.]|uniref:response regulator n=1 Tax=Piscinibacter sp. TaxID=1903157 RepID=UPI002ED5F1D3